MRVKWNSAGFRALLADPAVVGDLRRRAGRVADAAGEGFVAETEPAPHTRARAAVIAVTGSARRRNAEDNVLIRSLGAGR